MKQFIKWFYRAYRLPLLSYLLSQINIKKMAKNADKLGLWEPELFWRALSQLTTESSFSRRHLIFLDMVVSIRANVEVRSDIFPELFRLLANFKTSSSSAWVEKVSVTVVKISGTRVQLLSSFLKKFNDNINNSIIMLIIV